MALVYHRIWIAQQPLIKQECQVVNQNLFRDKIVGHKAAHIIRYANNDTVENYFSDDSISALKEDGKKLLDKEHAEQMLHEMRQAVSSWWGAVNGINRDCSQPEKLAACARLFQEKIRDIFAYFLVSTEFVNDAVEQSMLKILQDHYSHKSHETLMALTTPVEEDLLTREKKSLLELLNKRAPDAIQNHMRNFPFLLCNIDSTEHAQEIMTARVNTETREKLSAQLEDSARRIFAVKSEQSSIFAKINSPELEQQSYLIQQLALLRLELKNCWSGMNFSLLPFFTVLAKHSNLSVRDITMFCTTDELLSIAQGSLLDTAEFEQRKRNYMYHYDRGKITLYAGNDAVKARQKLLDPYLPTSEIAEFTGTIACKGIVRGKVRLVKVDDLREIAAIAHSIAPGTILVTGMTNPNMMVLIERICGIITDEGGMACHAAIVSREYNIPCIVGTRIATRALKDGDEVELDATTGIVRILDRAA